MSERRGTKALETWCRRMTDGYPGVKVENMTTSWRNGLAFCAIIHHFRPDLIEFSKLNKDNVYHNNSLAFRLAERHLGIPALLDAEDMVEYEVPDRLSILTYLSQFYQVLAIPQGSPSRIVAKRPAVVTDRGLGTPTSSSPPTKMAVRPAGISGGALGRREPCAICALPVFLAERLNVGAKLYHRTCFRCARCKNQLSLANCYETEDGQYCCETCPDEEETSAKVAKFDSSSHTFDSLDSSSATSHTFDTTVDNIKTPYKIDSFTSNNSAKKLNDELSKFDSSSDKSPKFSSSFTNRLSNFDSSSPKFNSPISNKDPDSFELKRQRLDQVRNRSLSDEEKTKGLQQFEDDEYSASFENALEEKVYEDDSLLSKARNTFLTSHLLNEDPSSIETAPISETIIDNSTSEINILPEHLTKPAYIKESATFTTVPPSATINQLNQIENTPPPLPSSKPPDPASLTTISLSSASPSEPCVNKPSNTNQQIQTISDETTNLRIKNATKDDTTNRSSLVKSRMLMFEEQTSDSPASLDHKTSIVTKYFNNNFSKKADNNVPLNIFENNSSISDNLNISTKLTENVSNLEDISPTLSNTFKNDQNYAILTEGECGIMVPFTSGTSEGINPVLNKGDIGILLPFPKSSFQNDTTESVIGTVLSVGESGIIVESPENTEKKTAVIAIGDSGILSPLIEESKDNTIESDLNSVEIEVPLSENLEINESENSHTNKNVSEIYLQTTEDITQTSEINIPDTTSNSECNNQDSSQLLIEDSKQESATSVSEDASTKLDQDSLSTNGEIIPEVEGSSSLCVEAESTSSNAGLEDTSELNIEAIKPVPLRRNLLDKTSIIVDISTNLQQSDEMASLDESHSNNSVTPQLDDSDILNDSDMKHKILRSDNNSDSLDSNLEGNSSPKVHPRVKFLNKSLYDNLSDQTEVSIDSSLLDSTKSDIYPDDLNPFGDEDETTETKRFVVQKLIKPSIEDLFLSPTANPRRKKSEHRKSSNPFDSEEDEVIVIKPPLPKKPGAVKKIIEAPKINLNPFWSDGDEHSEDDITKPVPLPRTKPLGTPEPKPRRSELSNNSDRYNSNSSLSSLNSSFGGPSRKKKPAPLPPSILSISPLSSKQTSPCSSTHQSPRLTPKFRKNRKAPQPPTFSTPFTKHQVCHTTTNMSPITDQSDLVTTPVTEPLNGDLAQLSETQYFTPIGNVTGDFESEKINKDEKNRNRQSQTIPSPVSDSDDLSPSIDKSMHGKWKRKKGPAPARPVPQRRQIKPLPLTELRRELDIIEMQQQGLEKQGVKLEQLIREKCEGPDATDDTVLSIEVEDMVLELFELVNEKNELFRKQAELMYLRRQQRLEEEYADLEYQIRCLMDRPERNKTDTDKAREEELINRLVEVVERRNEIVECLEMDRVREAEEDHSINSRLNSLASKRDEDNLLATLDSPVKLSKKEKKKMKKDKKMKEKGKTLDVDKDIDESETSLTSLDKKKKKKKWFLH